MPIQHTKALSNLPYTIKQTAEILGVSRETVRREIVSGRLKARKKKGNTKNWYITQQALNDWAENMLEDADE